MRAVQYAVARERCERAGSTRRRGVGRSWFAALAAQPSGFALTRFEPRARCSAPLHGVAL